MAATDYNDDFNPFSDDRRDEYDPKFANTRVVLTEPSATFDMTEFPIYFDEGLSLRQMVEQTDLETSLSPEPASISPSSSLNRPPQELTEVLLTQPRRDEGPSTSRRQIPVYTVGWTSTTDPQVIASSGLEFLTGVHEVLIQQTVTSLDSPNRSAKRYIVKIPNGETLYSTSENSKELDRVLCGSQRGFHMSVLDQTQQEAVSFVRRLGCVIGCFPCMLQKLHVNIPGSQYIGRIMQDFSFRDISFTIVNSHGVDLFRIFGPDCNPWAVPLETKFPIAGGTGGGRLGVIERLWNNNLGDYNLQIKFPAPGTPNEEKMLLIGAALLIEYMFYEHRKTSCIRLC